MDLLVTSTSISPSDNMPFTFKTDFTKPGFLPALRSGRNTAFNPLKTQNVHLVSPYNRRRNGWFTDTFHRVMSLKNMSQWNKHFFVSCIPWTRHCIIAGFHARVMTASQMSRLDEWLELALSLPGCVGKIAERWLISPFTRNKQI